MIVSLSATSFSVRKDLHFRTTREKNPAINIKVMAAALKKHFLDVFSLCMDLLHPIILCLMGDDSFPISEASKKSLEEFGLHIRTSRIARCMTQQALCLNTGLSRSTLQQIEKGSPHVSIGNYARVLDAMGIQNHFGRVVLNDLEWARSQMRMSMKKRFRL